MPKNKYGDVVLDTSTKEKKRKRGGKNVITTKTVEKGRSASRAAKLKKSLENKDFDEARKQSTMAKREGAGRIGTKTYVKMKGTGGEGAMYGSTIAGTKTGPDGRTMKRTLKDGSKVVVEGSVSEIKKKRLTSAKPKADLSGLERVKPREKTTAGKPSAEGTAPKLKEKETAPLKMRPITSRVRR
jgi:hypothetical protein